MPDAAPALRVHAFMLGVRDIDASVAFYTDRLGLTPCGHFEDFAFFDAHGTTSRTRMETCSRSTARRSYALVILSLSKGGSREFRGRPLL
jgi:hypothetical protein